MLGIPIPPLFLRAFVSRAGVPAHQGLFWEGDTLRMANEGFIACPTSQVWFECSQMCLNTIA